MTQRRPETRFTFIEMLFALTVAEIASQVASLAQTQKLASDSLWSGLWDARCAFAHLAVATALVAASWVGWSHSKAAGNKEDTTEIFRWSFVVLIVDLALVIVYYIIARGVDQKGPDGRFVNERETESFWIFVTFSGYAIWDVLTKLRSNRDGKGRWHEWRSRGWVSLLCAVLALGIWRITGREKEAPANPVLLTDGVLFCLVFLFRALKQVAKEPAPREGLSPPGLLGRMVICCGGATKNQEIDHSTLDTWRLGFRYTIACIVVGGGLFLLSI